MRIGDDMPSEPKPSRSGLSGWFDAVPLVRKLTVALAVALVAMFVGMTLTAPEPDDPCMAWPAGPDTWDTPPAELVDVTAGMERRAASQIVGITMAGVPLDSRLVAAKVNDDEIAVWAVTGTRGYPSGLWYSLSGSAQRLAPVNVGGDRLRAVLFADGDADRLLSCFD